MKPISSRLPSIIILILITLLLTATSTHAENQPPILIGAHFSLSGWGAEGGKAELNGATMAVEEINSRGGVHGRHLKLLVEDNGSDFNASAAVFRKLSSLNKVPAMIGPNWAEFFDIVAPLAAADNVPVVSASGYKEARLTSNPWIFTLWPPPKTATQVLADEINAQGIKSVTLMVTENAYYQELALALKSQLIAHGIQVEDQMNFPPSATDFRSSIGRATRRATDVDTSGIVAFLLQTGDFAAFLRQMRELKVSIPVFGANTVPFDTVLQKNLTLANGLTYFDYITPGGEEFTKRYRTQFNEEPGFGSAKAYDGVMMIAQALSKCGEVRSCIREHLKEIKYNGISGEIEFDERGVIKNPAVITRLFTIVDGKIVAKPTQ